MKNGRKFDELIDNLIYILYVSDCMVIKKCVFLYGFLFDN